MGEVLDKLSILYIKQGTIDNAQALRYITEEIDSLDSTLRGICLEKDIVQGYIKQLTAINRRMWKHIKLIQDKIKNEEYDEIFINSSIMMQKINDERFLLKNKINHRFGSKIKEVKEHIAGER